MATLPVSLLATPFSATATVSLLTDGRFDYLKHTLYLLPGNTPISVAQTTRANPDLVFTNLQGATNYSLVSEAYKRGGMIASASLSLSIGNESAPASQSLSLKIPYVVTTLVGTAGTGYAEGAPSVAKIYYPVGVAADLYGNIYIADNGNNRIRKIASDGTVSTLAGSGAMALQDGTGAQASFNCPQALTTDAQGNVFVSDSGNNCIRKITPAGVVTTLYGCSTATLQDGTGLNARFNHPEDLKFDDQGNLFVADAYNHVLRKIQPNGYVSTYVGSGVAGSADGIGTSATFDQLWGVAIDPQGNLYVTDRYNQVIRKIDASRNVTKYAGNGVANTADGTGTLAGFNQPIGIACDAQGYLYVVDAASSKIRKISPNAVVTTIAGSGVNAEGDGTGLAAKFWTPHGMAIDSQGKLYVVDYSGGAIRKVE
jgi:sugar lactone lactonase YvrE